MRSSIRLVRHLAPLMAIGLLVALIAPAAIRSSRAGQQTIALAPGDQLTITCETNLSGAVQGQQATVECVAPPPTDQPSPPVGPAVTHFNGVQDGQAISGNVAIEALVSGENIAEVEFQLDGPQPAVDTDRHGPYFFMGDHDGTPVGWDTTQYPDGDYMLTATATNRDGQSGSLMVHFHIANAAPPPPTETAVPPTETPPGSPAPTGTGIGLQGAYYDSIDFTALKGTRVDPTVDFEWGLGAPIDGVEADTFSVRWSGQVQPRYSEQYTFFTVSDDGVRLWINGQLLIDDWTDHATVENSGTISLVAGQWYDLKLEYYDQVEAATVKLLWASPSQPKEIIPQSQLAPAPAPPTETPMPEPTAIPNPSPTESPAPEPTTTSAPTPSTAPTEVPVAGQTCPAWVHDRYTTLGPDGHLYPTWHPQKDPQFGCYFHHEHGSDPALFAGAAHYQPPFGYVATLAGMAEPHTGFKNFLFDDGAGHHWLITAHLGSAGQARACVRFHSVDVAIASIATGELLTNVHVMGDFGPSFINVTMQPTRPANCPHQYEEAVAEYSQGTRQLPSIPTGSRGYEPWAMDAQRLIIGFKGDLILNTPSAMTACSDDTCSQVEPRPPVDHESHGAFRFLSFGPGFGFVQGATSGAFTTDVYGRTLNGPVQQYVQPGFSVAVPPLRQDLDNPEEYQPRNDTDMFYVRAQDTPFKREGRFNLDGMLRSPN